MLDDLVHRGPDDHGILQRTIRESQLSLAARRLAIQDLSPAGHQPMLDEASGNILVFNGEIYNAPELRSQLQRAGHRFRGSSDTEVVLRAHLQWREEAFPRLRGMFAVAVWDQDQESLLLARDPLGIKPLYYAHREGVFGLASEVGSLQLSGIPSSALNHRALRDYLAFGSIQDPHTMFLEVQSLLPGHMMRVDSSINVHPPTRYWWFPKIVSLRKEDAASVVDRGRELLRQSVSRHLLSDVPIGVFLSSGLDSSVILHLASEAVGNASSFTVTFPDQPEFDESLPAAAVAKSAQAKHTECAVSSAATAAWTLEALEAMDQPTAEGLNTFIVSRAVSEKGLKVALSGLGGDEIFGGYRSFRGIARAALLLKAVEAIPPSARSALVRKAAWHRTEVAREKLADMARVGSDLPELFLHSRRMFSDRWLDRLGVGPLGGAPAEVLQGIVPRDAVASVARLETSTYLRNTLLRDGDVFGMANSLEIRVPMLDQEVVEWALSLPGEMLLPPRARPKHLLRTMFAELLLPVQLEAPKRGFDLPLAAWLQGPLASLRRESLASLKMAGVVDRKGVEAFEKVFATTPVASVASRIWTLVVLGRWIAHRA